MKKLFKYNLMIPNHEDEKSLLVFNTMIGSVFRVKERVAIEWEIRRLIIDSKQNSVKKLYLNSLGVKEVIFLRVKKVIF